MFAILCVATAALEITQFPDAYTSLEALGVCGAVGDRSALLTAIAEAESIRLQGSSAGLPAFPSSPIVSDARKLLYLMFVCPSSLCCVITSL